MIVEHFDSPQTDNIIIKIVGVGGGGNNAVANLMNFGIEGIECIVINTDAQVLEDHPAQNKLHIGRNITNGLGAGGNVEIGREAALEDCEKISDAISGADLVIILAGMGGGTGTGAAPVVSALARDAHALTLAVVTTPFDFEGMPRMYRAVQGLKELEKYVDTYAVIQNENLVKNYPESILLSDAFKIADDIPTRAVSGIANAIGYRGLLGLDFNDLSTVLKNKGYAVLGMGKGSGKRRAEDAVEDALNSPLLANSSIFGATSVFLSIVADEVTMRDTNIVSGKIQEYAGGKSKFFNGVRNDNRDNDTLDLMIVATGMSTDNLFLYGGLMYG
jgi:cell division protein FtsZ